MGEEPNRQASVLERARKKKIAEEIEREFTEEENAMLRRVREIRAELPDDLSTMAKSS